MSLRSSNANSYRDEENPYWISFSDIMSGLLVLFILAALALILELTETRMEVDDAIKEVMKAEEVRRELIEEIRESLEELNIFVIVSEDSSVIHMNEQVLSFDSDNAEIPKEEELQTRLTLIGGVLHDAIVKEKRTEYLDTIFVEGHTDPCPSRKYSYMNGNWTLSSERAINVWLHWENTLGQGYKLSHLTNYQDELLFSTSGYAATRPTEGKEGICGISTDDELRPNRRIDLRFTLKRFDSEAFKAVRELVE